MGSSPLSTTDLLPDGASIDSVSTANSRYILFFFPFFFLFFRPFCSNVGFVEMVAMSQSTRPRVVVSSNPLYPARRPLLDISVSSTAASVRLLGMKPQHNVSFSSPIYTQWGVHSIGSSSVLCWLSRSATWTACHYLVYSDVTPAAGWQGRSLLWERERTAPCIYQRLYWLLLSARLSNPKLNI